MDRELLDKAMREGKVFKISDSFFFAAQIPDDSVGISGSRCSNCGGEAAYCHQLCRKCNLPFVGPFGFPQWPKWKRMAPGVKVLVVEEVFHNGNNRGRLGYTNVEAVPLSPEELRKVEQLCDQEADYFLATHKIAARRIREILAS